MTRRELAMTKKKPNVNVKLKRHRQTLLRNCQRFVGRFESAKSYLEIGQQAAEAAAERIVSSGTSSAKVLTHSIFTDSLQASDILVLVHAGLVQEWTLFLDSVFSEIVLYYLKIRDPAKLPSQKVDLRRIDPKNLTTIINTISDAAKMSFSFQAYEDKIHTLRDTFSLKSSQLDPPLKDYLELWDFEMTKHVEIRNIFQHSRGKVRPTDLDKIGRTYFDLLDDNGNKIKYTKDHEIVLTLKEIEHLNEIIKLYSEKFGDLP